MFNLGAILQLVSLELSRTKTFDSLDPSPKCHLPKLKHISAEALP